MRIGLKHRADGRFFPFNQKGETVIGSAEGCHVVLDDGGVGPQHAKIRISTLGIEIDDLGCSPRTIVNSYPITKHLLCRNDEIRVGNASLVLELDAQDSAVGPRCRSCGAEVPAEQGAPKPVGAIVQCAHCVSRPRVASGSSRFRSVRATSPTPSPREPEEEFNPLDDAITTKRFSRHEQRPSSASSRFRAVNASSLEPELLGDYSVVELLGEGSQGKVWKLKHRTTGQIIAAKQIMASSMKALTRFEREIEALKRIQHPAIVSLVDVRTTDSSTLLLMEFVEGLTLSTIMKRVGQLEPARALRLMARLAEGLSVLATRKVVHRDVKPSNILIANKDDMPKLIDFGLVRLDDAETRLTAEGQWIGTPHYMAPEQMTGDEIDARTDVWGLGATFYHAIAGRLPFEAQIPADLFKKILHDPIDFAPIASLVGPAATEVFEKILEKQPSERYSPAEAAAALTRVAPRA